MAPEPSTGKCDYIDWGNLSDLTELEDSSDEEEEEKVEERPPPLLQSVQRPRQPPTQRTTQPETSRPARSTRPTTRAATEDSRAFDVGNGCLPPINVSTPSILSIYQWVTTGLINTTPPYQRDVVWSEQKQTNLIESIATGYPIPFLIFRRWYDPQLGKTYRVCIDGKQRLTSLQRFMDGEIPFRNSQKKKVWWKKTEPQQRRVLVDENFKSEFVAKSMYFIDLEGITEAQERAIFQRVQLGTILTPAERLQAINGNLAEFVRNIRKDISEIPGLGKLAEWGKNRGKDFLALAQIVFIVSTEKAPATLPEPEKLTAFLEGGKQAELPKLRDPIIHSFQIFGRLLQHSTYGAWLFKGKISAVEFVLGIYVVVLYRKRLTDCQLADALKQIWGHARSKSCSTKTKSGLNKSCTEMRNMIDKLAHDKLKLQRDPQNTTKAANVPLVADDDRMDEDKSSRPPSPPPRLATPPPVKAAPSKKRSRVDDSDDDDTPLSKLKTEKRKKASTSASASAPKKAKVAPPARRNVVASDDDMEDDESDPPQRVRRTPPKRTVSSSKARPSAVGAAATKKVSAAETRVKRPPPSSASASAPPPPNRSANNLHYPSTSSASNTQPAASASTAGRKPSASGPSSKSASSSNRPATSQPASAKSTPARSAHNTPVIPAAAFPGPSNTNNNGARYSVPATLLQGAAASQPGPLDRLKPLRDPHGPRYGADGGTPGASGSGTYTSTSTKLPTPPSESPVPEEARRGEAPGPPPTSGSSSGLNAQGRAECRFGGAPNAPSRSTEVHPGFGFSPATFSYPPRSSHPSLPQPPQPQAEAQSSQRRPSSSSNNQSRASSSSSIPGYSTDRRAAPPANPVPPATNSSSALGDLQEMRAALPSNSSLPKGLSFKKTPTPTPSPVVPQAAPGCLVKTEPANVLSAGLPPLPTRRTDVRWAPFSSGGQRRPVQPSVDPRRGPPPPGPGGRGFMGK
ncbi:hypothetical protein DFP72DRAFT_1171547 [Ephemerocybe angulata]|uniref:GmrSD restriction endonucleases N-terminal domain-containing protein n=1 Tax=Ephemerocybe angulata TaxID=980116 RepID=A0A8H6M611_9AGAR|nr:hypothetical protein DFP72DRAFT_1171547 [Tulosesus angulatus]